MLSKRTRRDALRLGGAGLTLLAGCLTDSAGSDPGTRTDTETSTETTEPYATTETFDVAVDEISVAPELVAPNSPDSIGTFGERDEQFVVAQCSADGSPKPARTDFSLVAGDDSHTPIDIRRRTGTPNSIWDDDGYADATDYLVFSLPKPLDADEVTLRWPGGERALTDDAVERLARPPTDFAVREFSAPESVESGEEITLTVVVENTGDVDGTFVGALNQIGPQVAYAPVAGLSLDAEAGESATWTRTFTPSLGSSGDSRSMRLRMDRRGGDESVSAMVERPES